MIFDFLIGLHIFGDTIALMAVGYGAIAVTALCAGIRDQTPRVDNPPAVTIMKPLCGVEPELYENLRSFCVQDYPNYQIIFGAGDPGDPALAVARRLCREFSHLHIDIVICSESIGNNRKVDNLANMLAVAAHDYLIIADSDIHVGPDYLERVVAPLTDPAVGIVTCLYRGRTCSGLWSRLGRLFIDDWFQPSVLIAHRLGSRAFAFGATIGICRGTLESIGGFAALAHHLADDYKLGALTRDQGLSTVLSEYIVDTSVHETSLRSLIAHESRWMRTIRSVQPIGYGALFISFTVPLALLGLLMARDPLASALLTTAILLRFTVRLIQTPLSDVSYLDMLLIPVREFLTCYAWIAGLISRCIIWRGRHYVIEKNSCLRRTSDHFRQQTAAASNVAWHDRPHQPSRFDARRSIRCRGHGRHRFRRDA